MPVPASAPGAQTFSSPAGWCCEPGGGWHQRGLLQRFDPSSCGRKRVGRASNDSSRILRLRVIVIPGVKCRQPRRLTLVELGCCSLSDFRVPDAPAEV